MSISQKGTWDRIAAHAIDDPTAERPFSARLANENGWDGAFTARAVQEYRRFAYLCTVAAVQLTPSEVVDEVWHLHLLYTRDYWGPFTAAMGRPLHHGPSTGGTAQDVRYEAQYEDTLSLYRREFGDPPADIWPAPAGGEVEFAVPDGSKKRSALRFLAVPPAVALFLVDGYYVFEVATTLGKDAIPTLALLLTGGAAVVGAALAIAFPGGSDDGARARRAGGRAKASSSTTSSSSCGVVTSCGSSCGSSGCGGD